MQSVHPPEPEFSLSTTSLPLPPFWTNLPSTVQARSDEDELLDALLDNEDDDLEASMLLHPEDISEEWHLPEEEADEPESDSSQPPSPSAAPMSLPSSPGGPSQEDEIFIRERDEAKALYEANWSILQRALKHLGSQEEHMDLRFQKLFAKRLRHLEKAVLIWDETARAFGRRSTVRPTTWESEDALFFRAPVRRERNSGNG